MGRTGNTTRWFLLFNLQSFLSRRGVEILLQNHIGLRCRGRTRYRGISPLEALLRLLDLVDMSLHKLIHNGRRVEQNTNAQTLKAGWETIHPLAVHGITLVIFARLVFTGVSFIELSVRDVDFAMAIEWSIPAVHAVA